MGLLLCIVRSTADSDTMSEKHPCPRWNLIDCGRLYRFSMKDHLALGFIRNNYIRMTHGSLSGIDLRLTAC